jgi:hypothetical protein
LESLLGPIEAEAEVLRLCVFSLREAGELSGFDPWLTGCHVATVRLRNRPSDCGSFGLGGVFTMDGAGES